MKNITVWDFPTMDELIAMGFKGEVFYKEYFEDSMAEEPTHISIFDEEFLETLRGDARVCETLCFIEEREAILNLTQHSASGEQVESGVVEPENKSLVQGLLTFDSIPDKDELEKRATLLAEYTHDCGAKLAMIGGAPFFMAPLEIALIAKGIKPLYAFSQRVSEEDPATGEKKSTFKHIGFVESGLSVESIEKL